MLSKTLMQFAENNLIRFFNEFLKSAYIEMNGILNVRLVLL